MLGRIWTRVMHSGALPNLGSEARDHLANERTWLAWTRTSLAFAALGLGVDRFDLLRQDVQGLSIEQGLRGPSSGPSSGPGLRVSDKASQNEPTGSLGEHFAAAIPTGIRANSIRLPIGCSPGPTEICLLIYLRSYCSFSDSDSLSGILLGTGALISIQSTARYFAVAQALSQQPSMFVRATSSVGTLAFTLCAFSVLAVHRHFVKRDHEANSKPAGSLPDSQRQQPALP